MTAARLLSRPLEARELDAVVHQPLVQRIASNSLEVPLLPDVAARIISSTEEDFDFKKLSEYIHRDQALAGHVLRIANSAAMSGSTKIVSLQQAMVRLGIKRLKEIVMAVVMKTKVFQTSGKSKKAAEIWRDAAGAACIAREIARIMRSNVETSFLCGLLHAIGKPVVLQLISEIEKNRRVRLSPEQLNAMMERHYVNAGKRLAVAWGLPEAVLISIAYHRKYPEAKSHKKVVAITAAAQQLVARFLERGHQDAVPDNALPVYGALNLYPDEVDQLLEQKDAVRSYVESMA